MQALDGKIVEAEDQAAEADEKSLTSKSEWENKDLDWKGRHKEWTQKLKKESRNLTALEEARAVIKVVCSFVGPYGSKTCKQDMPARQASAPCKRPIVVPFGDRRVAKNAMSGTPSKP